MARWRGLFCVVIWGSDGNLSITHVRYRGAAGAPYPGGRDVAFVAAGGNGADQGHRRRSGHAAVRTYGRWRIANAGWTRITAARPIHPGGGARHSQSRQGFTRPAFRQSRGGYRAHPGYLAPRAVG